MLSAIHFLLMNKKVGWRGKGLLDPSTMKVYWLHSSLSNLSRPTPCESMHFVDGLPQREAEFEFKSRNSLEEHKTN
jgi:hypothetical protein